MVSAVLGKRNRNIAAGAGNAELSSAETARLKRRTRVVVNDENEDPIVVSQALVFDGFKDVPATLPPKRRPAVETPALLSPIKQQQLLPRSRPAAAATAAALSASAPASAITATAASATVTAAPQTISEDDDDEDYELPVQTATPQTPRRHRDALSKKTTTTTKKTPVTPRHRVGIVGKPLTPRLHLLQRSPSTATTPTNTTTTMTTTTVYNAARQLFARSAHPGRLVGRDAERTELRGFVRGSIAARTGGCVYVSGPPGTGKSALVREICAEVEQELAAEAATTPTTTTTTITTAPAAVKMAYVNCMSAQSAKDLFGKLLADLTSTASTTTGDNDNDDNGTSFLSTLTAAELAQPSETLQKMFLGTPTTTTTTNSSGGRGRGRKSKIAAATAAAAPVYVVALDEIDHLATLALDAVYSLFAWALMPATSRLVLIGIANALDFTDRFLPRLKARNLAPRLLPFLPYAAPQIASVITTRLRSLLPPPTAGTNGNPDVVDTDAPAREKEKDYVPFMHPAAIQLCARKVASQTGDIRRAFDICRRAIDLAESETRRKYVEAAAAGDNTQPPQPSPQPSKPSQPLTTTTTTTCYNQHHPLSPPSSSPFTGPATSHLMLPSSPCHHPHRDVLTETAANLSPSSSLAQTPPPHGPSSPFITASRRSVVAALSALTPATAPRATIAHVAQVAAGAFGGGGGGMVGGGGGGTTAQRLNALTLHQKAALCAFVALERRRRAAVRTACLQDTPTKYRGAGRAGGSGGGGDDGNSNSNGIGGGAAGGGAAAPITVRALYETYATLCRRDGLLAPLSGSEFRDVVSHLETLSLVGVVDGSSGSSGIGCGTPGSRSRRGRGGIGGGGGGGVGMGMGMGMGMGALGASSGSGGVGGMGIGFDDRRIGCCVGEKEIRAAAEGVAGGILKGMLADEDDGYGW